MPLNKQQIKQLRGLAHHLNPVAMVGQHGLRESVLEEIELALECHELIKVKVAAGDRKERDTLIQEILQHTQAELVQRIGNMAILFKRNPEKKGESRFTAFPTS